MTERLSQFADDNTLLLYGSDSSMRAALNLLDQYAKFSGLKPNIEKACALWIGSMRGCDEILRKEFKLTWTVKVLGILLSTNQ